MFRRQNPYGRVLLCVALSILLHAGLGLLLLLLPPQERIKRPLATHRARAIQVVRTAARKQADTAATQRPPAEEQPEQPRELRPTAKTSTDTPQALPDQPEYEGGRNTRAASAPDARHHASAAHAPAMEGEAKEELVTFDQERQDGPLEHEGKAQQQTPEPAPTAPPAPEPPAPPAPAPAEGLPEGQDTPDTPGRDATNAQSDATPALTRTDGTTGQLKLQEGEKASAEQDQQTPRRGMPGGPGKAAAARLNRPRVFYDPSLADWAQPQQPGFRTHERRSRSSGRFIFGRGAALNVLSTPRGEYEAQVYRRVAHFWYIACDDHRGDIIPGKITISLRIDKRGRIDSMALIKRSGASISQQSFTFKAIRRATLPPMPPEVQADVIGNLMELIFEFNFD